MNKRNSVVILDEINNYKTEVNDNIQEHDERKLMHGFTIWQIGILAVWYVINVWVVQRW